MAGVGFNLIPLRVTRFKCMTEWKKTGANGDPGRVQRSDIKGQNNTNAVLFPIGAACWSIKTKCREASFSPYTLFFVPTSILRHTSHTHTRTK